MKIIDRIIEYGIYLVVLIIPFQTRFILFNGNVQGGSLEYERISLYAIDILIIGLLFLWLIKFFKDCRDGGRIPVYWWIIAGLDLAMFVSIFYSSDRNLAFYRYSVFLAGVGLFFLMLNSSYKKVTLYLFLSVSMIIQGVLAIFQFLVQDSPASKWLGMSRHFPGDLGVSVIETFGSDGVGERWLRAYGSFDHPNILGSFLAIGLLFLLYMIVKKKLKPKTPELNLCLVACYLGIFGLVLSFSRSAWLATVFGIGFLLIYFLLKKNWFAQMKILTLVLIGLIVFSIPFFIYNNLFITRLSSQGRLEEKSLDERSEYLSQGLTVIRENPIGGVGLGNYVEEQTNKRPQDPFWTFEPVHNTFLLVLSELGIAGFLFFLSFLAWLAVESLEKGNIFNLSILLSLVIIMMFDHFWWSLHFGVIFFWLIMALLVKNLKDKKI